MSDFFTSLVGRSFGTASVIRPRVTSLFEPIREDAVSFRNTPVSGREEEPSLKEQEIEAESPEKRQPEKHVARLSPEKHEHRPVQLTGEPQAPSVRMPSPQHVREPKQAGVVERAMESGEANVTLVSPTKRDVSDGTLEEGANRRESEANPVRHSWDLPAIASPSRQPAAEEVRNSLLIPPKLAPEMRLSDLALSASRDRRQNERERNRERTLEPSEPSVQVTIGRIEIRATKESARPTRPPSASPVMSLDEYLRGRAQRVGQ